MFIPESLAQRSRDDFNGEHPTLLNMVLDAVRFVIPSFKNPKHLISCCHGIEYRLSLLYETQHLVNALDGRFLHHLFGPRSYPSSLACGTLYRIPKNSLEANEAMKQNHLQGFEQHKSPCVRPSSVTCTVGADSLLSFHLSRVFTLPATTMPDA